MKMMLVVCGIVLVITFPQCLGKVIQEMPDIIDNGNALEING